MAEVDDNRLEDSFKSLPGYEEDMDASRRAQKIARATIRALGTPDQVNDIRRYSTTGITQERVWQTEGSESIYVRVTADADGRLRDFTMDREAGGKRDHGHINFSDKYGNISDSVGTFDRSTNSYSDTATLPRTSRGEFIPPFRGMARRVLETRGKRKQTPRT